LNILTVREGGLPKNIKKISGLKVFEKKPGKNRAK
jgi:hypothetical protein